jgi:hypothetical protein
MYFRFLPFCLLLVSQRIWAFAPVIETQVSTTTWYGDGHSVVAIDHYHYGADLNGRRGFLNEKGKLYEGSKGFILDAGAAIRRIEEGGPAGKALVSFLMQSPQTVCIVWHGVNLADIDLGAYVYWNPLDTCSAPDERGDSLRPAYIGLAHELAHISDVWMGTVNRGTWMTREDENGNLIRIPYAELYATRVENKIRSENGIPLRVAYASVRDGADRDMATLIIRPGTRESLYYDCAGRTNYRPLRRRSVAERY